MNQLSEVPENGAFIQQKMAVYRLWPLESAAVAIPQANQMRAKPLVHG